MLPTPYNCVTCIPSIPTIPYVLSDETKEYVVGLIVDVYEDILNYYHVGNEIAFYADAETYQVYVEDGQTYFTIEYYEIQALRDLNETYSVRPETE